MRTTGSSLRVAADADEVAVLMSDRSVQLVRSRAFTVLVRSATRLSSVLARSSMPAIQSRLRSRACCADARLRMSRRRRFASRSSGVSAAPRRRPPSASSWSLESPPASRKRGASASKARSGYESPTTLLAPLRLPPQRFAADARKQPQMAPQDAPSISAANCCAGGAERLPRACGLASKSSAAASAALRSSSPRCAALRRARPDKSASCQECVTRGA